MKCIEGTALVRGRTPVSGVLHILFASLVTVGVACSDRPDSAKVPRFSPGTVGDVAAKTELTMDVVRKWYAIVTALAAKAAKDSTIAVSLNFQVDDAVSHATESVLSSAALSAELQRNQLTPQTFVAASVLVGWGIAVVERGTEMSADEKRAWGRPTLAFFETNRSEFIQLNDKLRRITGRP